MYGTVSGRHGGGGMGGDDHSDCSSSSSSADFMANPFQAFRPSLFSALKSPPDGSEDDGNNNSNSNGNNHNHNDTLPSLHDKSWIGARMSPIPSYNDNETDEYHPTANATIHARQPSGFVSLSSQHAPSAGHARTEYPPFGIHPLQPSKWPLSPAAVVGAANGSSFNGFIPKNGGTWVCAISGLCLLSMGVYDLYCYLSDTATARWDPHWTVPLGQPSDEASIVWGALVPSFVLQLENNNNNNNTTFYYKYWRILTSALQSNSVLEWCFLVLAWYVCQRPSIHKVSGATVGAVYAISTLTGQLWMLALWLLDNHHNSNSSNSNTQEVAHCAAWGTSGILCFIGMTRPSRRFGCFMICIVLVILSLVQKLHYNSNANGDSNPLPVVVGCTTSSFVGWALYGSQLFSPSSQQTLRLTQQPDQLPIPILTDGPRQRAQIHSSVRLCCGILVMILWMLPLLVLAYLDYYHWEQG